MKKKRRPARHSPPPVRSSNASAVTAKQVSPAPRDALLVTQPVGDRRPLSLTVVVVGFFAAVTFGGVYGMVMANRWISPEDLLPWIVLGISGATIGLAGIYFAVMRKEARSLPYVLMTARDMVPVLLALAAVNATVILHDRRSPTADVNAPLREQVERLSTERKDLMKALFAAGKFETQASALKAQLQQREASLTAAESERKRLLGELEAANSELAVERNRIVEQTESASRLRAEAQANANRAASLEALQRDTRTELQAIRDDLKRGRRVTDAHLLKVISKIPADASIAAE